MGRRPFVRFFHLDWSADTDVDQMTMEEVGTYWTLLVRQMVEGFITTDRAKLRKRLNVDTVEEVDRLLTPNVLAKFVPLNGDPTKLHNKRLTDVIQETEAASWKGSSAAGRRWDNPLTPPALETAVEERPVFDFAPILKDYPPRKNRAGYEEGVRMMQDSVADQETYNRLWAAVRAYRKERGGGQDQKFTIQLNNFMKDWTSYVPANYRSAALKLVEPAAVAAPAVDATPPTGKRAEREKPPWENYDSVQMQRRLDAAWPPERRQAWEDGKESP